MLVGVPASGKSTLVEKWHRKHEVDLVISSDRIRQHITGDAGDVSQDKAMWPIYYTLLGAALEAGLRVALDSTNLKIAFRRDIVHIANLYGVKERSAHIVHCTLIEAVGRNADRDRQVPLPVMRQMWQAYQNECSKAQLEAEGFRVVEYPL